MALTCVMCVYEEEDLLPGALRSLEASGVDRVAVYDGAWEGFGDGPSGDRTVAIAREWGADPVFEVDAPWRSQEEKRTTMFRTCGAVEGDHVFVFDADERLEGTFPALRPGQHYNVAVKCVGPNDMPGIRGEWPRGDYAPYYKPEIRIFAWHPDLHCLWPGGYWIGEQRIEPYKNAQGDPLLPVAANVSFLHLGNRRDPERIARKIAYYREEHPKRQTRVNEAWRRRPW